MATSRAPVLMQRDGVQMMPRWRTRLLKKAIAFISRFCWFFLAGPLLLLQVFDSVVRNLATRVLLDWLEANEAYQMAGYYPRQ